MFRVASRQVADCDGLPALPATVGGGAATAPIQPDWAPTRQRAKDENVSSTHELTVHVGRWRQELARATQAWEGGTDCTVGQVSSVGRSSRSLQAPTPPTEK